MQLRLSSAQFQVHLRCLVDFQGATLFHPLNHREEASKGLIGHRSKSAQRMKKYRQNILQQERPPLDNYILGNLHYSWDAKTTECQMLVPFREIYKKNIMLSAAKFKTEY